MLNTAQNYDLGNLSLDEIMKGVVPLPNKENGFIINLAQKAKNDFSLEAVGQYNDKVYVLGKQRSNTEKRFFQEHNSYGNLLVSDSFKRKTKEDSEVYLASGFIGFFTGFGAMATYMIYTAPILEGTSMMVRLTFGFGALCSFVVGGVTPSLIVGGCRKINHSRKSVKERLRKTENFDKIAIELRKVNQDNLKEVTDRIGVFQGDIDEVSEDTDRKLVRVDTGEPEKCIYAKNDLELRLKTYLMGADTIVHYLPGHLIGTPVKYADLSS